MYWCGFVHVIVKFCVNADYCSTECVCKVPSLFLQLQKTKYGIFRNIEYSKNGIFSARSLFCQLLEVYCMKGQT